MSARRRTPAAESAGQAFARFARTRDPAEFAAAFDATSQGLLLVATRLGGARGHADDLLQQTWHRALQRAGHYDPARPLLPWLIGILIREARREQRDRSRQREHLARVGAQLDDVDDALPLDAAAQAEFSADAALAFERIDATHRHVLMLRLLHGLSSVEIARALDRSPETVRSQLARGLEKLRRLLPPGHALPALALVDLPSGAAATPLAGELATVRQTLLAELTAAGPASTTTLGLGLGVIAVKKLMISAAVAVALLVVLWNVLGASPTPHDPAERLAMVPTAAAAPADDDRSASAVARPDAADVARTKRRLVAGARDEVTLTGRCVDAAGEPLAGASVTVVLQQNPDPDRVAQAALRADPAEWSAPEPAVTGDDGRFEFALVPILAHKVNVVAEKPGHVLASVWTEELAPEAAIDVGDLSLPPGCLLRGRVVDRSGAPVPGLPLSLEIDDRSGWPFSARTTADGRFTLRSPAPPGLHALKCPEPVEPDVVELGATGDRFLTLTMDRAAVAQSITGTLVDRSGEPLADRRITATDGERTWHARSDSDGGFRFTRRADDPDGAVRLAVRLEYETAKRDEPVAWGTRGVRLEVGTGVVVDVRVVDGASQRPVGRFGVRLIPTTGAGVGFDSSRRLRQAGEHPDGWARIADVLPGPYMLAVDTADPAYAPPAYRRLEVGDVAPPPAVVEVWPPARVTCEVFAAGSPCAGSRIELLQVTGGVAGEEPIGVRPRTMPYFGNEDFREGTLLAEATTDAAGRATLLAPRGGPFAVRISGDHRPEYREGVLVTGDARLRFDLAPSASVVLRIRPWPLPTNTTHLEVGPATIERGSAAPGAPRESFPIDSTGRLHIVGLAAGTAQLAVRLGLTAGSAAFLHQLDIEVAGLRATERREVDVDLAPWLPVELRARVIANDLPARDASLSLEVASDDGRALGSARVEIGPDGRVTLAVPRGRARGAVHFRRGRVPHPIAPFRIDSGDAEHTIRVRTGDVRVRVLASDGVTPLAGIQLVIGDGGSPFGLPPTDADGTLALGPTPCGPLGIALWPRSLADVRERLRLLAATGDPSAYLVHFEPRTVVPGEQSIELIAPRSAGYE